jgi:restriction system protein
MMEMAMIPKYDEITLPFLNTLADGKEYSMRELMESLAEYFKLDETQRRELLPSGKEPLFDNRLGWARTYLKKALLIESPIKGKYKITSRGMEALKSQPKILDKSFLKRYPEFLDFLKPGLKDNGESQIEKQEKITEISELNPEEALENSYQTLRMALASEILEQVKQVSPAFFERLVVDVLVAMGYGGSRKDAGQAFAKSRDGGVDGIIKEDKLGLDVIYIQAKRWENPISRPDVQGFAGSLEGFRAKKGVFITTSRFTKDATDYVERISARIILIDGQQLAQLMIDYNVGTTEYERYIIKRLDSDYFIEE